MGALSDLVIVDLSRVLAGPYCTMLLGDFGARVIKVEQPGSGDDTRHFGPPVLPSGESAYYLAANRNKQSVTVNLQTAAGREIIRDLACRGDVLVENFKVGTLRRMGLGYEALHALNPRLIYCSITGYGQNGPYHERPGYDNVIQAQGGIMSITGPVDGEPSKVGVAVVDVTAGLYALSAILAALHHRDLSGEGQFIDVALFDAQLGWLVNVASDYLLTGQPPRRHGNAHATIVPYQAFEAADGWLMVAVANDGQFAALARILGHPAWAADPRFATNPARVTNRDELVGTLAALLRTRKVEEWSAELLAAGIPCGPINDIPTALQDPQATARAMVQVADHPVAGKIPLIGPVPKLSATPAVISGAPPTLGEHTAQVLTEFLGYSSAQIAKLQAAGAI